MQLTLALTGASGAIFGREALRALEADARVDRVYFLASAAARRVASDELALAPGESFLTALLGARAVKTVELDNADIAAPIASGSHPSDGMIVLPCSMGALGRIAGGLADDLVARAADVALKERRPLILCVRESPFNRIHLRNMTLAAEAGATIFPVMPAFYFTAMDSTQMARQFVARVLSHVGLRQPGAAVWGAGE